MIARTENVIEREEKWIKKRGKFAYHESDLLIC